MAGDDIEANGDIRQRPQYSVGMSSSSLHKQQQYFMMNQLDIPQLNMPQFGGQIWQLSPNSGVENNGKRVGIPPSHPQMPPISPYSQFSPGNEQMRFQSFITSQRSSHTRSLSQPPFFALDSLPPLSPSPYKEPPSNTMSDMVSSADVSMEDRDGSSRSLLPPSPFARGGSLRIGESLPPRKAHRRSSSDVPFGFMSTMQSSTPLVPLRNPGALDRSVSARENSVAQPVQLVKRESNGKRNAEGTGEKKSEAKNVDDLFSAYMNLENIEAFNSSGTDEKLGNENRDDLDSRASGSKTNAGDSSDNEATSSVNESGSSMQKREGLKRNAGGDIAPTTRHYRSVSMDSFMGKMNFTDELLKMPPSPGNLPGQLSPVNSIDPNSDGFDMEFGNGEFSGAELMKIMANEKLAEIAVSDPKRAKRILANRLSAARSKERKMRYIAELEHKVQTLQTEATTLSTQLTLLQRDAVGLNSQNHELKFRLQAMEQQAHLRDALNEALTAEVQRLKLATVELSGDATKFQQLSIGNQMFQLRNQAPHFNIPPMQQQSLSQEQSQQSNGNNSENHEAEQ